MPARLTEGAPKLLNARVVPGTRSALLATVRHWNSGGMSAADSSCAHAAGPSTRLAAAAIQRKAGLRLIFMMQLQVDDLETTSNPMMGSAAAPDLAPPQPGGVPTRKTGDAKVSQARRGEAPVEGRT